MKQDFKKFIFTTQYKPNILDLINQDETFRSNVISNIKLNNKEMVYNLPKINNVDEFDEILHQTSFLYRIFCNYKYIKQYSFTQSNNFGDDSVFKYNGTDSKYRLINVNEQFIEREILCEFCNNYKTSIKLSEFVWDDKVSFIYNFLVFLCFYEHILVKIEEIETKERMVKFRYLLNVFGTNGEVYNKKIENELIDTDYKMSQTKNKIIKYFLTFLF